MVGTARAESAPESPLPEDYVLLDRLWLDDEQAEALLLLGSETENVVRLGIAQRTDTGEYALSALTQPMLPYDMYDSALSLPVHSLADGAADLLVGLPNRCGIG